MKKKRKREDIWRILLFMGVCACGLIMVMCVEGKKEKEGTNENVTRGGEGKEKIGSDIGGLCFVFGYV